MKNTMKSQKVKEKLEQSAASQKTFNTLFFVLELSKSYLVFLPLF